MQKYLLVVRSLTTKFRNFRITYIPRGENELAVSVANELAVSVAAFASIVSPYPCHMELEIMEHSLTCQNTVALVYTTNGETWATPILRYLEDDHLPEDRKEAYKIWKPTKYGSNPPVTPRWTTNCTYERIQIPTYVA